MRLRGLTDLGVTGREVLRRLPGLEIRGLTGLEIRGVTGFELGFELGLELGLEEASIKVLPRWCCAGLKVFVRLNGVTGLRDFKYVCDRIEFSFFSFDFSFDEMLLI